MFRPVVLLPRHVEIARWLVLLPFLALVGSCNGQTPQAKQPTSSQPTSSQPTSSQLGDHRRPTRPAADLHQVFDRILAAVVRDELVDYLRVRKEHRQVLRDYLHRLAEIDPAGLPTAERLAFCINLYNATMIAAVVERVVAGYSPAFNDHAVFKEPLVAMSGGRKVSLNHLENEIIRKTYSDPRIHVALVCGARSCPPLLPRAYRAADLDQILDRNMRRFVKDPSRNRIEVGSRRATLSKIFEWYADDFGGKDKLLAYVARYSGVDTRGFEVGYMDYSWQLNIARPVGQWLQTVSPGATLHTEPGGAEDVRLAAQGALLAITGAARGEWIEVEHPTRAVRRWVRRTLTKPW